MIFHIATAADWDRAQVVGQYETESLRTQGFIHCSTQAQVIEVANALFKGRADLVLLEIDADQVEAEIRYENCEGGATRFPHVYGSLDLAAVRRTVAFEPGGDGRFALPDPA